MYNNIHVHVEYHHIIMFMDMRKIEILSFMPNNMVLQLLSKLTNNLDVKFI